MGTNHNEHDEALARILAALGDAAPPEGMNARIAQRLQAASTQPAGSPWRDLVAAFIPSSEWARGAIAGAAVALVVAATVFLIIRVHVRADHSPIAARSVEPSRRATPVAYPLNSPTAHALATPCSNLLRSREIFTARPAADLLIATNAPSHPAPALGLTAQERDLVRLVQTADPKQLAALDAEAQTKSQSDDDAQFDKFFAQPAYTPPAPPAPENNE